MGWFWECSNELKDYNERKIYNGFQFNNNICKEDVDLNALLEYFDKVDNEKKFHYTIYINVTINEVSYHYILIDWKRYIFHLGWKNFFYEWLKKQHFLLSLLDLWKTIEKRG